MRNRASTFDIRLGRHLRAVRRGRGFSQERVGEYLGVSYQQVQKYETGASRLTVGYLVRLGRLYREPLDALLPAAEVPRAGRETTGEVVPGTGPDEPVWEESE